MKNTLSLICLALLFLGCETQCLNRLMVGYKIRQSGKKMYDRLSKDPKFRLVTSESEFKEKGEFEARMVGKNSTYPNADSVTMGFSYSRDGNVNNRIRRLKVVSVVEYLKDETMVLPELERLKKKVCSAYKFEYSPFINGPGFVEVGINTDPIPYPSLELVPSVIKGVTPNIEILILDIDY